MNNLFLIKRFLIALSVLFIISCDTDFNELGANIVNGDLHNGIIRTEINVVAYDKATGSVQSNNLDINSLGVLDNAVFGQTKAHFVTQVQLATPNPTFGTQIVLDSVYLYIPYTSAVTGTDEDGNSTYALSNIYGNPEGSYRLRIRENGFFLRDADPTSSTGAPQKYYSGTQQQALIENYAGSTSLLENNADHADVRFDPAQVVRTAHYINKEGVNTEVEAEKLAPGLFLYLNKDFFQQKILNQATTGKLASNSVFKEYFRGIYFTADQLAGQSVMGVPKFKEGKITIKYTENVTTTNATTHVDTVTSVKRTMVLNLTGNTINFFENTPNPVFASAVASSNTSVGDDRLYLKGGEGSMAFLDIDRIGLDELKAVNQQDSTKVLINEANLVFYVDSLTMIPAIQPIRIYLYDANNKRPLYDYYVDGSKSIDTKYNKYVHGGILGVDSKGRSVYKVRITDHINNVINKQDSTNVKIGIVVTQDINTTGNAGLYTPFTLGSKVIETLPVSSVIYPFGTVLYGTGPAVPEDRRVKLEIFYTKNKP